MESAVYDLLGSDAELMQVLTGGVYHQLIEITRQAAPDAFDDNKEIKPCCLIKTTNDSPDGPYDHSSRATLTLFFYERAGYANIKAAMLRTFELLHKQKVTPGTGTCWQINWNNDIPGQEDKALNCSLGVSRYAVYHSKV